MLHALTSINLHTASDWKTNRLSYSETNKCLVFTEWPFTRDSVPLLYLFIYFFYNFLSFWKCQLSHERCLSNHLIPATDKQTGRLPAAAHFIEQLWRAWPFWVSEQCSGSTLSFFTMWLLGACDGWFDGARLSHIKPRTVSLKVGL